MLKDNKRVMNFKCLPDEEKPRERFIKYGKSNISNKELIEIILRSGTRKKYLIIYLVQLIILMNLKIWKLIPYLK